MMKVQYAWCWCTATVMLFWKWWFTVYHFGSQVMSYSFITKNWPVSLRNRNMTPVELSGVYNRPFCVVSSTLPMLKKLKQYDSRKSGHTWILISCETFPSKHLFLKKKLQNSEQKSINRTHTHTFYIHSLRAQRKEQEKQFQHIHWVSSFHS